MKATRSLLFFLLAVVWGHQIHAGSILMVHGHIDNPSLWVVQGNAFAKASGGTRFYDATHYYPGNTPAGGFQANGIYGVSYYQAALAPGQFEPRISPVIIDGTEISPDDSNFAPFLYQQADSLAARLAQTINTAYVQTGQKVILVCHSMGGLVAEAAIAYFGCENKVEKLITIGTPLRGFPADFRVPTEIIANQSGVGFAYARESLQMSEGVKYRNSALSVHLENRYKQVKPPGLTAVNIVGTLNPLPDNVLGGPSDGVVRAEDARFRDPSLATVYELPLTHMQRIAEVWSAPEDALCLSDRTTQILEKEALGLNPLPRLASHLSFNFDTGSIRVTVRNDGGLPLTFTSVSGRFELLDPANATLSRVTNSSLAGLVGQTLQPGQFMIVDGPAMTRGEKASVRLTLTVNGQQLAPGEASFIANIQAPEIELSLRYDFLNSVLQNEWQIRGGNQVHAFALNASYRLEGQVSYDSVSNRLKGTLTANFYGVLTGAVAIASSDLFYSESFPFDLEVASGIFSGQGNDILGKTQVDVADAASSQLRSLYRTHLLPLVTNPGPFVVEGNLSALAGLKLERPVFQFDPETQGVRLNFGAILILGFSDSERTRQLQIPMQASCSTTFINAPEGLVMRPQLRNLSLAGMALGENYRLLINRAIEANEIVVVPSDFAASINSGLKDGLEQQLGANAFPENFGFFDAITIAIEPGESSIRILMDFYDDALSGSQNVYPGVSQNAVAIQDRLLNQLLERSVDYVNRGMTRSGINTKKIGFEVRISALDSAAAAANVVIPIYGPISFSAGIDKFTLYVDKVQITFQPDSGRKFQTLFQGPNNRVHLDVPVNAEFYYQVRTYLAARVGVYVWGVFVGVKKRWEAKEARISIRSHLAVDLDANIYPFVRNVNGRNSIGINFPPKEIDLDVRSSRSSPELRTLGEVVVEPLFKIARDDPKSFALIGAGAGALLGYFAPEVASAALSGEEDVPAAKEGYAPFGRPEAGEDVFNQFLEDSGLSATNFLSGAGNALGSDTSRSILAVVGFAGGAYAGYELGKDLEDAFDPKQYETTVDLPANIQLKDLTINSGAARLGLDVKPAYGRVYVDRIIGLNATNGVVRLSRDDFAFSSFDGGPFSLTYAGGGAQSAFSTVWVKKALSKIRMHLRYEAIYLHRYNTNTSPDYTLQQLGGDAGSFTTPADYEYDSERDAATFTVEVPVFEGQTSLQQFRLKVPGVEEKTIPILVGRDTAPILINAPFAAYSGVSSNVTVSGGSLVYQNENSDIPGFVLEELKLLKLTGASSLTNLKPLGLVTTNVFGPAVTRTPRLHGAQFSWTGNLAAQQYSEGSYAALVTIRETTLNRKGSLLVPFIIDRTPPTLQTWTVTTNFPVMSRHQDIGLAWRMTDAYSATLRDVALTYQKQGGLVVTGANFTTPGTVMIPGQRRLDFTVDMSTVPNGVEDTYTVQFQAKDVPGNQGVSSNLTFLVDTRPPTLSQSFIYPASGVWLNQSNRIMSARLLCPEPVTAQVLLQDVSRNSTNDWYVQSVPLNNGSGLHQVLWTVELPDADSDEGLREGFVGDGQHQLSVELVDRGGNTNFFSNRHTFNVDRRPPVMSFAAQQTFIPAGRTEFSLSLNRSKFQSGDYISRISLVDLQNFTATDTVASATIGTWNGGQIEGVLASGVPLGNLDPGYYGVEVIARDQAGNESRITTQFGYQLMQPHVEVAGFPVVSGIVPLAGIAIDPNPADRFSFASREVYWAFGNNVAAPADLNAISPAVWQKSGLYVLPPRGNAFANEPNKSAEMVSEGILAYWNTTATTLTLAGDSQASISAAGIINSDVTVLLVVRDLGGQAWAATARVRVDNRQTDSRQINLPGVVALGSTVNNKTLSVNAALLRDTPVLQMVVLDSQGNAVYRTTQSNVESRNSLFGKPDYSPDNDFGYFVWYDEADQQLKVRCVSPVRNSQGVLLNKGHTFHFSIAGDFSTNDVSYFQLAAHEIPDGETIDANTNGFTRVAFALSVPPGTEKGVAVNYQGGTLDITPLGIDDYLEVLYEDGPRIAKRYWRTDDAASVTPGYLGWEPVRNLVGLEGIVRNGMTNELPDQRALANHSGVLGHLFVGRSRTEPIAPLHLSLTSASPQPDLTLNWDLRLPNGSLAAPGQYEVYLYTVDPEARRFHGARSTFTLTTADVPFAISGLSLSTTNAFNPAANGGIILNFNASRSSSASVHVRNAQGDIVTTIADRQIIDGRTDLNSPHQVWWDGYVDGAPASAGNYSFDLTFVTDGVTNTVNSGVFTVSYPTAAPRESDWGLITQPIAFDPDTRDRIIGKPKNFDVNSRAWVTLNFDALLADGTVQSAERQVGLAYVGGPFASVSTDTNTTPHTFIPVSSLFGDAIQEIKSLKVEFNDRVVDAFDPFTINTNNVNKDFDSRSGQFKLNVLGNGPKALRLQVILRLKLQPWKNGLIALLSDQNRIFDPQEVREFVGEIEFQEKPGTDGILESKLWEFRHEEKLWGYTTNAMGAFFPDFGLASLDTLLDIEIRDRNGLQVLAHFNPSQIKPGGTSAVDQLFTLTAFTNNSPAISADFVFKTQLIQLKAMAASKRVPVSIGYAGVNASLVISDGNRIADEFDPFPTRYYHAQGKETDLVNGLKPFDNVKAYSGDSGLVQEVAFGNSKIAGHIPFDYSLRPVHSGNNGQQTIQIHPWVPYLFRQNAATNLPSIREVNQSAAFFGFSVSSAGDVNGDGFDDVVIGAPYFDNAQTDEGRIYLYSGGPNGLSDSPTRSVEINIANVFFGYQVACAGDVNLDGYDDVLVVSRGTGIVQGAAYRSAAYILYGGRFGLGTFPSMIMEAEGLGDVLMVASAGDVNGDSFDDVIIGSPNASNGQANLGRAYLFLGGINGLRIAPAWSAWGDQPGARFGASVSRAGDVNGDYWRDVIIGAPLYNNGQTNKGRAFVYLGSINGLSDNPVWVNQAGSGFGSSVSSAGDVNGDDFDDVIVGAPGHGKAYVYLGSPSGPSMIPVWTAEESGFFGQSVRVAGDVNSDGYDDVIVGAPFYDYSAVDDGRVFLYLGGQNGVTQLPYKTDEGSQGNVHFGNSVSSAGDVNGDGYDDIVVGASWFSNGQNFEGRTYVYYGPRLTTYLNGWVHAGGGGKALLGVVRSNAVVVNMLTNPAPNVRVTNVFDPVTKSQKVVASYVGDLPPPTGSAPFPISPAQAEQWLAANFSNAAQLPNLADFFDADGKTNAAYTAYLLPANLKFAAFTNDMFIAASTGAYDVVVTNGIIDYAHIVTDDPEYPATLQYNSARFDNNRQPKPAGINERSVWATVLGSFPAARPLGLPAVQTEPPSIRPLVVITNIVLRYDSNFPAITWQALKLDFTDNEVPNDGGENTFVQSAFSHRANNFFRAWTVADDPNIKAAAAVEPENVQVTLVLSNFVYNAGTSGIITNSGMALLSNVSLPLRPGLTNIQQSAVISQAGNPIFVSFQRATLGLRITRLSAYSAVGEEESVRWINLDLTANRTYTARSSRYQCYLTPVVSGAGGKTLGFILGVELDPPVEFSVRKPLRGTNSIALPLRVIDRETFWQVDSGEYVANLFKEVDLETNSLAQTSGYLIDSDLGYTQTGFSRLLATDPAYAARAYALFWKDNNKRIIPNPRIIPGDLEVILKDPSGRKESPEFQNHRYVTPLANEYFNDLYLHQTNLAKFSWTAKIRPQAKEHAYIKVYGSVGGEWTLSYRKKESGQLSGILPAYSGALTWTPIPGGSGVGRGQNQFLTYWDITELNGPHILRLESTESPDNAYIKPEVKYLEVMLGQHLPGRNNPVFSPAGQPQTMSLYSMHGRTQLVSAHEDRADDDLFFTVNPIKIEEKPFSMSPDGTIPLGERVQILPHTDHNPFSVNFYIDEQEYRLYDQFRLYHQLEEGTLAQITSLPPSVRSKYTLIQGEVQHTSIVGFLPNPSLRYCTLNVPQLSDDGIIRVAGSVDLYGRDDSNVKNEDLTVAIVVSSTENFYDGLVKARLTTGSTAEFPIASQQQQLQAAINTGWAAPAPVQTFHVFAVVVNTNDNWLTLNRQLSNADAGQHLFNVSKTTVMMTPDINGSLVIANADGFPIFSPNGDGAYDTVNCSINFQREGLAELEFLDELGQSVHRHNVPLNTDGQANFAWNGNITGQGALTVAPDGRYTVIARYGGGESDSDVAVAQVEVRAFSKYFGQLVPAGITNTTGNWRTLFTHTGTVLSEDVIRLQYSDSTNFAEIRDERVIARSELSALFDDSPTELGEFQPDANDLLTLNYRLKVSDVVTNVGFSPTVAVKIPRTGKLLVTSVTPQPGSVNVTTEPVISMSLSAMSPFTAAELQDMIHLAPAMPRTIGLSPDRKTIIVTPNASFAPGIGVTAALQTYPTALNPGADTFAWSFSIMPSNLISRALQARIVNVSSALNAVGAQGVGFMVVSNAGNVPARVSAVIGELSTNVLSVAVSGSPTLIAPATESFMPVGVAVTGRHSGIVTIPLTGVEQSSGSFASLNLSVPVSSLTNAPTLEINATKSTTNSFMVHLSGQSKGNGLVSTLARLNGGGWYLVSQAENWSFDSTFSADGDRLEIVAMDAASRASSIYTYSFSAPNIVLIQHPDLSIGWYGKTGLVYTAEWSTDLYSWTTVKGQIQKSGSMISVGPGNANVQFTNVFEGELLLKFSSDHPAINAPKAFFRIMSSSGTDSTSDVVLLINKDRELAWDVSPGRVYGLEWSADLVHWSPISGQASISGSAYTVAPSVNVLAITNPGSARLTVRFSTNHQAVSGSSGYFRVKAIP